MTEVQPVELLRLRYDELLASLGLSSAVDPVITQRVSEYLIAALKTMPTASTDEQQHVEEAIAHLSDGTYDFNDYLNKLLRIVISAAGRTVGEPPVYVGKFPLNDFNACITKVPEGYLILLNSGLILALHLIIKTYAASWNFRQVEPLGFPAGFALGTVGISTSEAQERLANIVAAYFRKDDISEANHTPILVGPQFVFQDWLLASAETFVMGHEYGHFLAGHVGAGNWAAGSESVGGLDVLGVNWENEFEADRFGVTLAFQKAKFDGTDLRSRAVACGPIIFFGVCSMLEQVGERVFGVTAKQPTSHPPPLIRAAVILKHIEEKYGRKYIEWPINFLDWMQAYTDCMVEDAKK
jgi:hypothetical protein